MCYGNIGLFSIGSDCPKSRFNISVNDSRKEIYNMISSTNQTNEDNVIATQSQRVTVTGYTTGAPDLNVSQLLNLKIASSSDLSSKIDDTLLNNFSNNMQQQLDNILASGDEVAKIPENKELMVNMKKNIAKVITSESTKRAVQQKLSNSISIQEQDVFISFSQNVPELIQDNVTIERAIDGRPVISINQQLINSILSETVLNSLVNELIKDEAFVSDALKVKDTSSSNTVSPLLSSQATLPSSEKNKNKIIIIFISLLLLIFLLFIFYYK
jgi:hypothetical protein